MADDFVTAVPDEAAPTPDTAGQTIHVLSPDGRKLSEIPIESLQKNLDHGFKVAPPELVSQVVGESQAREKYEGVGSQIETGLEGAAEGATFGLSPIAERALGVKQEDIEQRAARNPLAHATGTVAGSIANAAVTGGAGFGGDALSAALQLGNVGSKVARAALTGAALNAAYSAGNQIDKAVLGDPEVTAAHAIGQVGLSALLGAGIGGAFGLGEAAVSPVLERISGKLSAAADKADQAVAKFESGEVPDIHKAARDVVQADQAAFDHTADLFKQGNGARAEEMHNLTGTMPLQDARKVATDYIDQAQTKLNDIADNAHIYRATKITDAVQKELDRLKTVATDANSSPEIQNELNLHKQVLDKILKTGRNVSDEAETTVNALKDVRLAARQSLESPAWGAAGERQAGYNAAATKYYDAADKYLEIFGDKEGNVSPVKMKQYLTRKAAGDVAADAGTAARDALKDAREGLVKEVGETFKNTSNVPLDKEALENLFSKNKDMNQLSDTLMGKGLDAAKAIGAAKDVTRGEPGIIEKLSRKALDLGGGIAGGSLGGAVLPGIGHMGGAMAGVGAAQAVGDAIFSGGAQSLVQQQTMARLLRMSEDGTKAIQNGVAQFLGGRTAAIGTQAFKALNVTPSVRDTRGEEPVSKVITSLRETTPDALVNHMTAKTAGIAPVAPEVGMHMGQQVGAAVQYMKTLLPPEQGEGMLLSEKQAISPSVRQRVGEAWDILNKPTIAPKLMANGELTSGHVQALKTVYQPLYYQMGNEIITQLAKNPKRNLSIQQEQQLTTFLGQPVRESYGPAFAQWAQANAIAPEAPPAGPKPSGKKLTLGQESFTQSEKQQSQEG